MKTIIYLLIVGASLTPLAGRAAQTAAARLYSTSITMHEGRNLYGDLIDLNYSGRGDGADELGVVWHVVMPADITLPGETDYFAYMNIYDYTYAYSSPGYFYLSTPTPADANNNRFPDFFEVARAVNQTSSGTYYYNDYMFGGNYNGTIAATWTRTAGSKSGTCRMTFTDSQLGNYWGTMVSTFEIVEYTGTLSYTPGATNVPATVNLTQTGNAANTWRGPIQFVKADTDRFNTLTNLPGFWTNAALQSFTLTNHYFFRNSAYPTNYAGYIEFDDDMDPSTVFPYGYWVLSINDANDANHNGVPDFSDDPQISTPPRRPQISLARGTTNLLMTIHGDTNHLHTVQQVSPINSTNWQNIVSVTLTNDPQVVPLARPASPAFWRVLAQ